MIEGTFKDASFPGLLQFLAAEPNRLYKVRVMSAGQSGEIYVSNGCVIYAGFNLLDGEDALCEFFSWREASFVVERLAAVFESTIKKNMNLRLQGTNVFVSQSAFLIESDVGLNSVVVPSRKFGSLEWQDAIRTQPLEREDFLVLGWIKEGRTLRQAAREFGFDLVKATGVLYRLLLTQSVDIVRTGSQLESVGQPLTSEIVTSSQTTAEAQGVPPLSVNKLTPANKETNDTSANVPPIAGLTNAVGGIALGSHHSGFRTTMEVGPYVTPVGSVNAGDINSMEEQALSPQAVAAQKGTIDCAPDPVSSPAIVENQEEEVFSARTTDALPLVTIDIERLLQAIFCITPFGKIALTNQSLDRHLREALLDVENGKSLQFVLKEGGRSPASILSTYRFCLARGYILSTDSVLPLTADLLLGRMEWDQYLLQRRRINGDELRDLIEIERQKGIKLTELLVKNGYLTKGDLERLIQEQKRFALK